MAQKTNDLVRARPDGVCREDLRFPGKPVGEKELPGRLAADGFKTGRCANIIENFAASAGDTQANLEPRGSGRGMAKPEAVRPISALVDIAFKTASLLKNAINSQIHGRKHPATVMPGYLCREN